MTPEPRRQGAVAERETQELWKLPDSLLEFVDSGDEEMIVEILTLFQHDSAERLRDLNVALANKDRDAIRKQAHTLKGAALQVGAMALSSVCLQLEKHADRTPEPELLELVCRAWEYYERTCREMLQAYHT